MKTSEDLDSAATQLRLSVGSSKPFQPQAVLWAQSYDPGEKPTKKTGQAQSRVMLS